MEPIKKFFISFCQISVITVLANMIVACGDKRTVVVQPEEPEPPEQVILFANVTGLPVGQSFVLQSNDLEKRIAQNGLHDIFLVPQGQAYSIELAEPAIDASCQITNGEGMAKGSDIRDINVVCSELDSPPQVTLAGGGEVLERIYRPGNFVEVRFDVNEFEGQDVQADIEIIKIPDAAKFIREPRINVQLDNMNSRIDVRFPELKYYIGNMFFSSDKLGLYQFKIILSDGNSSTEQLVNVLLKPFPPSLSVFGISPAIPVSSDDLSIEYTLAPNDYDPSDLSINIEWYVNDKLVQSGEDKVLSSDKHEAQDTITAKVSVISKSENTIVVSSERSSEIIFVRATIENIIFEPFDPAPGKNLKVDYLLNAKGEMDAIKQIKTTVEWYVNGQLILDNNSKELLKSNFKSGDSVTVAINAIFDGDLLASASEFTQIRQVESDLIFSGLPSVVFEQENVKFNVGWSDPNVGQSIVLQQGPAGAVLSTDGELTWMSPENKFDQQSYFFTFGSGEINQTIELQVKKTENNSFVRTASSRRDSNSNTLVLNLDGVIEIVEINEKGMLVASRVNGAKLDQVWVYPYVLPGYFDRATERDSLASYDINKDEVADIIVFTGKHITVFDGKDKQLLKSVVLNMDQRSTRISDFVVSNIDDDDDVEILFLTNRNSFSSGIREVYIIDDDAIQPESIELATQARSINVANVDDDESFEIITDTGEIVDINSKANEWYFQTGFGENIVVANINKGDRPSIVGIKKTHDTNRYQLVVYDATARKIVSSFDLGFESCSLIAGEFLVKGRVDISVLSCRAFSGNSTNSIYTLNSNELNLIWSNESPNGGFFDNTSFYAGIDVDGDGLREILWKNDRFRSAQLNYIAPAIDKNIKTVENIYGKLDSTVRAAGIYVLDDKQYAHFYTRENLVNDDFNSRSGSLIQIDNQMPLATEFVLVDEIGGAIDNGTIEIVDSNLDGNQEWLISNRSACFSIDIKTKKELWRFSGSEVCRKPNLKDINGDGVLDLILLRGRQLQVHDLKEMRVIGLYALDSLSFRQENYLAMNLDDDDENEIVFFTDRSNSSAELTKLDYKAGELIASTHTLENSGREFGSFLTAFDYDEDGRDEIVIHRLGPRFSNSISELAFFDRGFEVLAEVEIGLRRAPLKGLVNPLADNEKQLVLLLEDADNSVVRLAGLKAKQEKLDWLSSQIVRLGDYSFKNGFRQSNGSANLMLSGDRLFMFAE